MEIAKISILVPTFNRRKFLPLLLRNIKIQDYPHDKLEVIIDDDGKDKLIINDEELKQIQDHLYPIKLTYINNKPKRTIGKKRNDLVKSATSKIVCFMDDDDIYFNSYISYSYNFMKNNKLSCVGSDKMLFCMTDKDYEMYMIDCGNNKLLIHEATILMTKRFHRASMGFNNNSKGEGATLFMNMESKVGITDIFKIMCCLQHSENTIDKIQFVKDELKIDAKIDDKLKEILQHILNN
jgi:glycosyltransferase involved in cell wall biosynthesis